MNNTPTTEPIARRCDIITGRRIRNLRVRKGMKQSELAQSVGVKAPYMSMLENGLRKWSEEMIAGCERALQ